MSSVARKELQGKLLQAIEAALKADGFEARPAQQALRRKTAFGSWTFHLGFIPHAGDVDVTVDVALRFDDVEDLVNQADPEMPAREKARTATLGAELGNLVDGRQRRWTLADPSDVRRRATEIVQEFRKFGLPYLERFSDRRAVLEALSRNDAAGWRHSPIHPSRCMRAVAVAVAMNELDQARKLADDCDEFLSQRHDPGLAAFRKFISQALRKS